MPGPEYIPPLFVYLASDKAADINGQVFMTAGDMIGTFSQPVIAIQINRDWEKEGKWTYEEIEKLVPEKLLVGYVNPAPVRPDEKK